MKITLLFLSYNRQDNIQKIVNSLDFAQIEELIIFNNDPSYQLGSDKITIINSNQNLGCYVKYYIGQLAKTEYCLIIDDDLMLEKKTIDNFINFSQKYPDDILGYFGMNLTKGKEPYSTGHRVHTNNIKEPTAVDVILGRIHFMKTTKLAEAIVYRNQIKDYLKKDHLFFKGEDIVLSLSNLARGHKNYIIPHKKRQGYINLDENDLALSRKGGHMASRNRTVLEIRKVK